MSDETREIEESTEESCLCSGETVRGMAGPCGVWPPYAGCCGGGKAWVRIGGRWLCKPQPGCP